MRITNQFPSKMWQAIVFGFLVVELTACSGGTMSTSLDPEKNAQEIFNAASGPLEDLNLRREEIPHVLKAAAVDPYAMPSVMACEIVRTELAQLDQVLGPDAKPAADLTTYITYEEGSDEDYAPKLPKLPDQLPDREVLVDKGIDAGHDRLLDFIHEETNILPFRHIIRSVTGAEQHARKVEKAKKAGQTRRAFLKGLAMAKFGPSCLAPPELLEVDASPPPPNR